MTQPLRADAFGSEAEVTAVTVTVMLSAAGGRRAEMTKSPSAGDFAVEQKPVRSLKGAAKRLVLIHFQCP